MSENRTDYLLDVDEVLGPELRKKLPRFVRNFLKRRLHQDEINDCILNAEHYKGAGFCDEALKYLNITYKVRGLENLDLSKNIVRMMSTAEDCMDNDLFLNAVNVIYTQEPSYAAAYNLYKLYSSKNDFENAEKFLNEAVAFEESDTATDASYLWNFANYSFNSGKNAKAYAAALKVIELSDDYDGRAYWLIGNIWANTPCTYKDLRGLNFWVATDFMNKAKATDPALTEDADRAIAQYRRYFPNTGDAFMCGLEKGASFTVSGGGMSASTIVRTQD